ncbi:MAG: CocE/NonD family hydrolase, partial [Bacteroidetes bacterium]
MKILNHSSLILIFLVNNLAFNQLIETFDNVQIPMRDGEFLAADVYLPSGPGPFEVILIQTPYNKEAINNLPMGLGNNIDAQPYAWVIADWRGFYGSNGAAPGGTTGEDGYDICEWISQQSWHADRIGTWGPSALGKVQYETAFEQHPNHTCAVPLVAHPQFAYSDYFYGGVLEESRLQQLDALGYGLSPIILGNVYYSPIWQIAENTSWTPELINIPTLNIGGWYDHNINK